MTPHKIIESNKLIAEFDGYKFYNDAQGDFPNGYYCLKDNSLPMFPEDFCYHENWSWLMPVVEKIANTHYPHYWGEGVKKPEDAGEFDDCAYPYTFCRMDKDGKFMFRFNAMSLVYGETLIESVWLAVLEFIKWHNQQK